MRVAIGLLLAAVFFGALFYVTASETSVECTVCVHYGAGDNCATVSGPDRQQAMRQATTTACAPLTSGVTQGMECDRTPPRSATCTD